MTTGPATAPGAEIGAPRHVRYGGRGDGDAYARWRHEIGYLGELFEITARPADFHAVSTRLNLPHALIAEFSYCGMDYVRDAARVRADGCDMVWVQLTHEGGLRGRFGERDAVVGPRSAVFSDYSQTGSHDSVASRGRLLVLPRSAFDGADVASLHGRVVDGAAFARLDAYLGYLERAVPRAAASAADRVQGAIGAVVRATFDRTAEPELQDGGALDGLALERLRALIRSRIPDGEVEAAALARALGVSRAGLYRLAAPYGGVMAMVWELRLDAAHAALVDPAEPGGVGVIGQIYGFVSTQHFSRRFRERFGFSPSDLRGRLSAT